MPFTYFYGFTNISILNILEEILIMKKNQYFEPSCKYIETDDGI